MAAAARVKILRLRTSRVLQELLSSAVVERKASRVNKMMNAAAIRAKESQEKTHASKLSIERVQGKRIYHQMITKEIKALKGLPNIRF